MGERAIPKLSLSVSVKFISNPLFSVSGGRADFSTFFRREKTFPTREPGTLALPILRGFPQRPMSAYAPRAGWRTARLPKAADSLSCAVVATVGPVLAMRTPLLPSDRCGQVRPSLLGEVCRCRGFPASTPFRCSAPHGTVRLACAHCFRAFMRARPCHCLPGDHRAQLLVGLAPTFAPGLANLNLRSVCS